MKLYQRLRNFKGHCPASTFYCRMHRDTVCRYTETPQALRPVGGKAFDMYGAILPTGPGIHYIQNRDIMQERITQSYRAL